MFGIHLRAPDGSYVSGDSYSMTPDGGYVGGDGYQMTPDGDYVIVDYKTGHTTPSKVPDNLQLNIYCMAIQEKFGKLPTRASFF